MYNIPSFYSFLNVPAKNPARISPKEKEEEIENSSPTPSMRESTGFLSSIKLAKQHINQ